MPPEIIAAVSIVIAAVVMLQLLWEVPRRQVQRHKIAEPKDELDLEIKARTALAQILGGLVLLIGIYSTWRSFNLTREQQVTDRFTAAVEQLGNDKRAVRIGGLYALERIAEDSPRDRPAVIQVLASYVRDQRPWECDYAEHKKCRKRIQEDQLQFGTPHAEIDIQAAMNALLAQSDKLTELHYIDLSNCDLRGVDFSKRDLRNINLNRSYLGGAKFAGANLTNYRLVYACIPEWTEFEDAQLHGFNMAGVISTGAPLLQRTIEQQKRERQPSKTGA